MAETDQATQHYLQWVESYLLDGLAIEGAPHRKFVSFPHLKSYFLQDDRLSTLLYKNNPGAHPSQMRNIVLQENDGYIIAFATLLKIGAGQHISHFVEHLSLRDACMPFTSRPSDFPLSLGDRSDTLFERFKSQQWIFCPATIGSRHTMKIPAEQILPITYATLLEPGGSGQTWKIKIHPPYNNLRTADASRAGLSDSGHAEKDTCYVMKTYHKFNTSHYRSEKRMYTQLCAQGGPHVDALLKFHGGIERSGFDGDVSYSIILEYANGGNLESLMDSDDRPKKPQDIAYFWLHFLEILRALWVIESHKMTYPDGDRHFEGWHQDVKPENIVLAKRDHQPHYRSDFKLADLGLAHFRPRDVDKKTCV